MGSERPTTQRALRLAEEVQVLNKMLMAEVKRLKDREAEAMQIIEGLLAELEASGKRQMLLELQPKALRFLTAKRAANERHDRPGGSRDKQKKIQQIWASGKYSSRDLCAEQECAALNMSFSSARKALKNTPTPSRC